MKKVVSVVDKSSNTVVAVLLILVILASLVSMLLIPQAANSATPKKVNDISTSKCEVSIEILSPGQNPTGDFPSSTGEVSIQINKKGE